MKTNKDVSDIGEYSLVELIKQQIKQPGAKNRLVVGPGDDAFVAKIPAGQLLVATKDLLVEDIHFKTSWTTPWQLGYKAMASNISDIAAMGGATPLYAMVGLALPGNEKIDFVSQLSKGMRAICDKYGVTIAGGDTVSSRSGVTISVTLLGSVKKKYIIRRSGARPGDLIYSTGCFGDSGAGLYLLSHGAGKRGKTERCLVNKHLLPEPRIAESKIIAANGLATSMIDSSDGLSASVGFLATESGIGAKIFLDSVPLSTEMQEFKKKYVKADFWNIVTGGGEEYELVFTAAPGKRRSIERLLPRAVCFGEIAKGRDVMYYFNGNRIDVNAKGFEHFR